MIYQVWIEGYKTAGQRDVAMFLGEFEAPCFEEACKKVIIEKDWNYCLYDEEKNTHWGCRFFDNEADARKGFG